MSDSFWIEAISNLMSGDLSGWYQSGVEAVIRLCLKSRLPVFSAYGSPCLDVCLKRAFQTGTLASYLLHPGIPFWISELWNKAVGHPGLSVGCRHEACRRLILWAQRSFPEI